jgi:hypothetical protein
LEHGGIRQKYHVASKDITIPEVVILSTALWMTFP